MKRKIIHTTIFVLLVTSGISMVNGADLTVTKTFSSGETLSAGDLNDSFGEVEDAVTNNNERLSGINVNYNVTQVALSTTAVTAVSVNINSPSDGFVLVQFTGSAWINHTLGTRDLVRSEIQDSEGSFSFAPSNVLVSVDANQPTGGNYWRSISTQRLFPVLKNSPYTFYARVDLPNGVSSNIIRPYISATFIPNAIGTLPLNY